MKMRTKVFPFLAAMAVSFGVLSGTGSAEAKDALGIDVSNHNGRVDFQKVKKDGRDFAFVLATDGTSFTSDLFSSQYSGAAEAGLFRGAYHFARPNASATKQASRFLQTVDYRNDGKSLPPVVDMEANPDGAACYGLDHKQMKDWIEDFVGEVKKQTGRDAIIYTSPGFWRDCTGDSKDFERNPLWVAQWDVDRPEKIGGWSSYTVWQYSDTGKVDGVDGNVDVNRFNGDVAAVEKLAKG
jgi:GH25 family lysozyme M1 (1,4-beta-N-acetylmuramidase)